MLAPMTLAFRQRLGALLWPVALLALVAFLGLVANVEWSPNGRLIEAHVEHLGVRAKPTGFEPLLTVRLPDGSRRQMRAPGLKGACKPGDKVPLLQRGAALTIGARGCY
jgi:hypothetical protein